MRIRLRAPGGQHTAELADDATVGDLKAAVFDRTGVLPASQELKAGFPPKKIEGDDGTSLASVGVTNGESITVAEIASASAAGASAPNAQDAPAQMSTMDEDEALARAIAASLEDTPEGGHTVVVGSPHPPSRQTEAVRVVIDSDNSCLFNAVGYVMLKSLREAQRLRKVIADVVSSDEFTYNEGFLGKPNSEYCAWILDPKRWGGAVELSILSKHFKKEIAAYDIQTERCDVYGSGEDYDERVMLLYDGLHYDAMALRGGDGTSDVTIFPSRGVEAEVADAKARLVVEKAHAARQFTDVANFALRCLVCQTGLKGEKEAVEHAKSTGHQNFGEY
jgi:ubiquitin thioesterase OTU1